MSSNDSGSKTPPVTSLIAAVVGLAAIAGLSYFAYGFFAGGDTDQASEPTESAEPAGDDDILAVPEELTDLQIAAQDRGSIIGPSVIADRVGLLPTNGIRPNGISVSFVNAAVDFCSGASDTFENTVTEQADPDELIIIQHPDAQGQWFPHYQTRYSGTPQFVTCVETQPESSLRDVCPFGPIAAEPAFEDPIKNFGLYETRWTAVSYESGAGTPVLVTRPADVVMAPSGCPGELSIPADGNTLFPGYVNPYEYDGAKPSAELASAQPTSLFSHFYTPLPAAFARASADIAGPESVAATKVETYSGPGGTRFIQKEAAHLCETGVAPKAGYAGPTREGDFMVVGAEIVNADPLTLPDLIACFTSSRGAQIGNCTYVIDPLLETKRDEPIFALNWAAKVYNRETGALTSSPTGRVDSLPEDVCPNRWQPGVAQDSIRPNAVAGGDVSAVDAPVDTPDETEGDETVAP